MTTASEGLSYRASLELAMSLVRGRWHLSVLSVLVAGERRYGEIKTAVNEVDQQVRPPSRRAALTDKTLNDTLAKLVATGLVTGRKTGGVPAESWYQLTGLARELLANLRPFGAWAHTRQHGLLEALRSSEDTS